MGRGKLAGASLHMYTGGCPGRGMGGGFLRLAFLGWASLLGTFVAESCLAAG